MSTRTRNLIVAAIAIVALLGVIAVIVLASIRIRPLSYADGWLEKENVKSVDIYHSSYDGARLPGETNGKLIGDGDSSGVYCYDDLFDSIGFSLISACLQFNYSFGLGLADNANVANNEMTGSEMRAKYEEVTGGKALGYSFVISLSRVKTMELKDSDGRKVAQDYDTVMFTVTEDSDWVRNIDAYAFEYDEIYRDTDVSGEIPDSATYYKLRFGLRTGALLDMLEDIYDLEPFPEETDDADDETEDVEEGADDGAESESAE